METTRAYAQGSGARRVFGFSESDALRSEADHRISNSLTLLASAVSLRAARIAREPRAMDGEEVSQLLGEIESQIVAVAQVHRLLSRQPAAKSVDLCENLTQLSRTLMSALDPDERIEVIHTASEACPVGRNTLLPVSLIVTELLTNSLKHAHPRGEKGRIMIGCRKRADGSVIVEVGDDGSGFGEDFDPESTGGLGFRTIRLLAQRLGAQLTHATGPLGVCFTLRLPPSEAG